MFFAVYQQTNLNFENDDDSFTRHAKKTRFNLKLVDEQLNQTIDIIAVLIQVITSKCRQARNEPSTCSVWWAGE